MISHPTAAELAEAVARFEAHRTQSERDAFLARVAGNALAIIEREAELGPAAQAAAVERLTALLGQPGDFATLNETLCDKLATGALDLQSPGVLDHLRASAIDQVLIDQPAYSGLKALRGDA